MKNVAKCDAFGEEHKHMDMIRHYHPVVKLIPLAIEMAKGLRDNGSTVSTGKLAIADIVVKPSLNSVAEKP